MALLLGLCACSTGNSASSTELATASVPVLTSEAGSSDATQPTDAQGTEAPETTVPVTTAPETTVPETTEPPVDEKKLELNVYSLKGPTSMGLAMLLEDSKNGKTFNTYHSTMCTAADEVTAALVSGEADIALLPANAAAALYNKAGGFKVVGINTLGVLYVVENGDSVHSIKDLLGKTVVLTGKGTTPEYALRFLLNANDIEDQVTLEFKSEAQEVVAALSEDTAAIGLLPQPFATAALAQNENLRIAVSLQDEWDRFTQESALVTGVTVVRDEVLEAYPSQIATFLKEAAWSVERVNSQPEEAAPLIEQMGIVAKAALAQKAIPFCNLVSITGSEMKLLLSGYLQTLYDQNPKAVGEAMPDDAFYFTGE
ncbi:MAG: PhnD/SsuA/transferrin family substrate-binding protein [Oscillospiraceae bacterium]|nr:PhnD/SsuA/transferrin family substrate-binding protein [Oscillospiraceae bacterium]